jgi:hypothetical protein
MIVGNALFHLISLRASSASYNLTSFGNLHGRAAGEGPGKVTCVPPYGSLCASWSRRVLSSPSPDDSLPGFFFAVSPLIMATYNRAGGARVKASGMTNRLGKSALRREITSW